MSFTHPARFTVDVPDCELVDLRERLEHFRAVDDFANDDWSYGFNGRYLSELREHWLSVYDWRQHERAINAGFWRGDGRGATATATSNRCSTRTT